MEVECSWPLHPSFPAGVPFLIPFFCPCCLPIPIHTHAAHTFLSQTGWDIEARVFTPHKITLSACVVSGLCDAHNWFGNAVLGLKCWSNKEKEHVRLSQAKYQAPCNWGEVLIWKCTCRRRHRRTHSSRHEPSRRDCDAKDVGVRRVRKAFCAAMPVQPGCGATLGRLQSCQRRLREAECTRMTNRWSGGGLRMIDHGSQWRTNERRSDGEDLKQLHRLPSDHETPQVIVTRTQSSLSYKPSMPRLQCALKHCSTQNEAH